MDHFSPGIRALRRFFVRTDHRVRLYFSQRNLAKAETELGLLGWQQAEFDAATQRQVDALQHVEREQADLNNRSAEIAHGLTQAAEERTALRTAFDNEYAALEAERVKAREPLAPLREQIAKLEGVAPESERRAAEVERDFRDAEKVYNKLLLIQPQTAEVRDEIISLREQLIALPNERNDLKNQAARRFAEIHTRQEKITAAEARLTEIDRKMRERKAAFQHDDSVLARNQRDLERDKARAEAEHGQLERAKINPYREIGVVLADNGIGPMNQPEALDRVMGFRAAVANHQRALVDIDAVAAQEDRVQVQMSLTIWVAIVLFMLLIGTALV